MAYSVNEIKIIHQRAQARKGRRYSDSTGKVYLGLASGRLRLLDEATLTTERDIKILKGKEDVDTQRAEQGSYFKLTLNNDVEPLLDIHDVLTTNIFSLNRQADIEINALGVQDEFFEYDLEGNIMLKDLFDERTDLVEEDMATQKELDDAMCKQTGINIAL